MSTHASVHSMMYTQYVVVKLKENEKAELSPGASQKHDSTVPAHAGEYGIQCLHCLDDLYHSLLDDGNNVNFSGVGEYSYHQQEAIALALINYYI